VSGYATGETVTGVARVPRSERPETKIILSKPANVQLLGSGEGQDRNGTQAPVASHPTFEPHPIQGWTPDFIALVLQEAIHMKYYDELMPIAGAEGVKWAKALAQKEGILIAISGGANFVVSLQIAERMPPGLVSLCRLLDNAERYLTTAIFKGIAEIMDEAELAISRLTLGFQMP
jgi:cysteine synthase A